MLSRGPGFIALALSLLILFVWIPQDVETGLFEKVRRSVQLGDAFAPTIAAVLIGIGGLLTLANRTSATHTSALEQHHSFRANVLHALVVLLIVALGLGIMRYAGPAAVSVFKYDEHGSSGYRLLRDTAPWKYVGFVLGGTFLVTALIAWTERRLRALHLLIGVVTTLVLIILYDLPFDDLLLPPNGDV